MDSITNENSKEHNKKWPFIPDHPYRIVIIGGFGSGETNALLNLISQQDDIEKIYLYAKDLSELKHEFLIKMRKDVGTKHLNDPNAFIECFNTMDDVYENIDEYKPSRKSERIFQAIIKGLFIRCKKFSISLVFITKSSFSIPKDVRRLNLTYYLIMKINNKKELQNVAFNHSADIDYKDFVWIYRECTKESYSSFDN